MNTEQEKEQARELLNEFYKFKSDAIIEADGDERHRLLMESFLRHKYQHQEKQQKIKLLSENIAFISGRLAECRHANKDFKIAHGFITDALASLNEYLLHLQGASQKPIILLPRQKVIRQRLENIVGSFCPARVSEELARTFEEIEKQLTDAGCEVKYQGWGTLTTDYDR